MCRVNVLDYIIIQAANIVVIVYFIEDLETTTLNSEK